MALITCPECGNSISEHAPTCPHCGIPRKSRHKFAGDPSEKLSTKAKIILVSLFVALLLYYAWLTGRLF